MEEQSIMQLPRLPTGEVCNCDRVFIANSRLMLARVAGKWYALNHRSSDPSDLRNRAERSTWAQVVGVPAKDVENYARRERRRREKERQADLIAESIAHLVHAGYTVTKP